MRKLIIETLPLNVLNFDPHNARKHGAKNLDAIAGSLKQFGQRKPIVIDSQNVIVAGNGTVQAAKSLGWKTVECVRVPSDWTDDEIKAFALADNRTAELAEWNDDILAKQLIDLDDVGFDVVSIGFESFENLVENFEPVDESPRLDEKNKTICPNCGHEF